MLKIQDKLDIKNLIYEVRGEKVMLDSEISGIKCHIKDASYE